MVSILVLNWNQRVTPAAFNLIVWFRGKVLCDETNFKSRSSFDVSEGFQPILDFRLKEHKKQRESFKEVCSSHIYSFPLSCASASVHPIHVCSFVFLSAEPWHILRAPIWGMFPPFSSEDMFTSALLSRHPTSWCQSTDRKSAGKTSTHDLRGDLL